MASILKVDTIQDQAGNNIINENANVITIGASGDTITIPNQNVGIGTTSPISDARLTVSSDNSESYIFFERSGSTRFDSAIGMNSSSIVFKGGVNSSTVSGLNEFMRIDDSGRVGIGTTNTSTQLNVVATGVNGINLGQQSDNTANSSRLFFNNSTNIWTTYSTQGNFKIASGATIGSASGTDRLVIDSSGNVGIGTSSPTQKLDVNGTVKATAFQGDGSGLSGVTSVGGATGVDFNDNVKARFGTGNDLEIYHDGSNSYIDEVGTGILYIKTSSSLNIVSNSGADETMAVFSDNGSVDLYYDNSKKFETSTDGVIVSGHVEPSATDTYDLGQSDKVWRNIYTGDLHLSNEAKEQGNSVDGTKGNWTIQEGAEDLYILNNKSGKKYKFKLEEI